MKQSKRFNGGGANPWKVGDHYERKFMVSSNCKKGVRRKVCP